jgi:endonuclease/exonuclease/phosphatase family metal-dependent hydrolase
VPGTHLSSASRCAAIAWLVALGLALPSGCGNASDPPVQPDGGTAGEHRPGSTPLRIMSFNIEWGGVHVRFASVADAIRAAGAEIVGVQEPEGNLARLAADLGWHYNLRNHVISKYPLIDPAEAGGKYVLVEILPGRVVAVANVHLPSSPSGAAWIRAGRSRDEIIAMERQVRLPVIRPFLDPLPGLARQGFPVFLSGDFNAPSHEDWTEETVGTFPHRDFAIAWPVTRAAAAAGLRDSFRDIHQNPVEHPGFTWWAGRPAIPDYNPSDPTRQTRIDFLWYGGAATPIASHLVGESGAPEVRVSVAPWPSDHRAVLSEFEVTPAPMPVLVAAEHRVHTGGQPLQVIYRNTTDRGSLTLRRLGAKPVTERRIALTTELGRLTLPGALLPPGAYELAMHDARGIETSRNDFWMVAAEAQPSVAMEGEHFAADAPLPVAWQHVPGNRYDWIAVYEVGTARKEAYAAWSYLGARSSGRLELTAENAEQGWPLQPGQYVARLLLDDGYALLAESAPFTVD